MCDTCKDQTLKEIDEALFYANVAKLQSPDAYKQSINEFIDDLLDARLELTK